MRGKLHVKVGRDLASLETINPNDESKPYRIKTQEFEGYVLVRIKDFDGIIPEGCERHSGHDYFKGKRHLFSLHVQGTFSQEYTANDIIWATEFERPINLPHFFISFWKAIAPHSMTDLGGQQPYIHSYAITASSLIQSWDKKLDSFVTNIQEDISNVLPSHLHIKKHKSFWSSEEANLVADRRKLFVIEENRKACKFDYNTTMAFETFNGFFDPNTFNIVVPPGLHIDLRHVLDGQPVRLALRTKEGATEFFVAEMSLQPDT